MNNISLIIPCAGRSSRFKGKPKWLKTCPNGSLMIQECLKGLGLCNVGDIYICFLKEHIDKFCNGCDIKSLFSFTKKKIHILIINEYTQSQSETTYKMLQHFNINGPIFIKDCDNYFEHIITKGNYVCGLCINNNNPINEIHNKSFIEINSTNEIINICEKQIISNKVCVGGYSFLDANIFKQYFKKCINIANISKTELYISHIIHVLLLEKHIFLINKIEKYIDWGTQKEWENYLSGFKTLFIDIDGTLFYNSSEFFLPKWGETEPILKNINIIKKLYKTGKVQIFLTTARKDKYRDITVSQLKKYDIPYNNIIFNLLHCKRFLINDYSTTNPYPSAVSINLKRDSSLLNELLS